jgi:uncharacterized protein Yka (UPF0111/DUF47 family)
MDFTYYLSLLTSEEENLCEKFKLMKRRVAAWSHNAEFMDEFEETRILLDRVRCEISAVKEEVDNMFREAMIKLFGQ